MAALKTIRKFGFLSTPVKLLSHLSLKQTAITSHRRLIYRHKDFNPAVSNSNDYDGNGHYNNINL